MYALILGLILMHENLPDFVVKYVRKYKPVTIFGPVWIALTSIRNAPNMHDNILRQVIIVSLR